MALETTDNREEYAGNGVTTAFPFPNKFFADEDLVVIQRVDSTGVETVKTLTTHYTVAGEGESGGGTVTMLTPPPSGRTLIIYRDPAQTQDLDLVENDPLPVEEIEMRLDKLTMLAQRLKDVDQRTVRLTEGFSSTFDPTLPALLTANALIKVNAAVDGFELGPTTDEIEDAEANATAAAASAAAAATSETNAGTSEDAAAASAAAAAAAVESAFYRDVVYLTSASSPYTVTQADNGKMFSLDSSGGVIAVTLPALASLALPFNVAFKLKTAGNDVTISRSSTDVIDGNTSKVLSAAGIGCQITGDIGPSPDEWTSLDFGTVADGSITRTKLAVGAIARSAHSAKTTTYAVLSTDDILTGDSGGGTFDFDLPTAVGIAGKIYTFIKTSVDTTAIVIDPNGSETINGLASRTLTRQWDYVRIISDGTNWNILDARTSSQVRLHTHSAYGSTNNKIPVFTTTIDNYGSAITYATSAENGASFTIVEPGIYAINYTNGYREADGLGCAGLSLNSSQLTTSIHTITTADRLGYSGFYGSLSNGDANAGHISWTGYLAAGAVVRPHTDGIAPDIVAQCTFTISKLTG